VQERSYARRKVTCEQEQHTVSVKPSPELHSEFTPCQISSLANSQYHGRGRCELNERPSSRLDGQLKRAEVGGSQLSSGGRRQNNASRDMLLITQPMAPDLSMGRVHTACLTVSTPCLSPARVDFHSRLRGDQDFSTIVRLGIKCAQNVNFLKNK
jgi:hypothetical protein